MDNFKNTKQMLQRAGYKPTITEDNEIGFAHIEISQEEASVVFVFDKLHGHNLTEIISKPKKQHYV